MKSSPKLAAAVVVLALVAPAPTTALAHGQKQKKDAGAAAQKTQGGQKSSADERLEPDDKTSVPEDVPESVLANRREQMNEDAEGEIPSYNNFLTSYRLGPEDVISISVFGLDKYTKTGITVPPDGRIDYYFVPDGLLVAGKTTRQVRDEITKYLDEYIIDPKVTVSLEKAMSQRYGVIGDVAQPGVKVMSHRLSVYEALSEAGGILPTGKKQVIVLHWDADRMLHPVTIDVSAIERGKAPDNYFLRPGDQIFVPGNKWKTVKAVLNSVLPVVSFARIFTGGGF